ncbi:MAG: isochorismatase family protein [Halomonas sp.]|nr:isochorismatase family protein [Halomonas sp.]MBP5980271.1 isochorismatase family protein [Halomonas sp.]
MSVPTTALLMIDVQSSFPARDYWVESLAEMWRPKQRALLNAAKANQIPVVRILHEEPDSQGAFDPANGLVCPLENFNDDVAVTFTKRVHNAFSDTSLERWLHERGITHIVVSGIRTEQCCETTARIGSDLGFSVDFVSDATLTFPMTRQGITWSAEDIKARTELVLDGRFARIISTMDLINEWQNLRE